MKLKASSFRGHLRSVPPPDFVMPNGLRDKVAAALVDYAPLTVGDAAGRILFANDAFCALTRYEPEELLGQEYRLLRSDHHCNEFFEKMWATIADGRTWKGEIRNRAKDGSLHWVDATIVPLPDGSGKPGQYLATYADITAVKRLQKSLRENERRYHHLVQMSPDGIFLSEDGVTTFVNDAGLKLLRARHMDELVGRTAFDFFHPDYHDVLRKRFDTLRRGPVSMPASEDTMLTVDGTAVPVEVRAVSYLVEGRLIVQASCRDISERKNIEQRLREERDYADAVLNSLPGVFYHYDENLRLLRWNRNHEIVTGYSGEELATMHPLDFFVEEERPLIANRIKEVFENGEGQAEADFFLKDGQRIPYLFTGVRFEHDGKRGFVGVGTDIRERKRMEEALREKTAMFEAQVESSPDAILVVDHLGRKVLQNQRMIEMWNTPPELACLEDVGPQLKFAARQVKDRHSFLARIEWLYQHPEEIGRDEIELLDGTIIDRYSATIIDREGRYYGRLWTHRDITGQRRAEQRIRYVATHDDLTGLPNRNLMRDRIAQAIERARRTGSKLALLYLDLDRFKVINDGNGHPFGDAVLKAVGDRLLTMVREGDTVARHGGDEFLILMTDLREAADAYAMAQKIIENLDRPVTVQDRVVHPSGSIGVSVFPQDGETAEALIGSADTAMYRAKDIGRNAYRFFTREMSEETQCRVDLETRLRCALASGQLRLAYQPKVSLDSGRIVGCEALLRWQDPELGEVSPSRFIPIAEDSGLIVPLGDWVLQTACAQARGWLDTGLPPISVAVNLSPRQFLQQDVVNWVKGKLDQTGLPPAQLELEFTESLIAQDVETVIATFNRLRDAGVKLSIDDFGTGYSSLSYLKRFRVDALKIDQSFVHNMLAEQEDATIVMAVVSLAHSLKFRVIAEGVETAEQCRFLRVTGCDEIQGYYFSRPVPAPEFEAMLRAGKRLSFAPARRPVASHV